MIEKRLVEVHRQIPRIGLSVSEFKEQKQKDIDYLSIQIVNLKATRKFDSETKQKKSADISSLFGETPLRKKQWQSSSPFGSSPFSSYPPFGQSSDEEPKASNNSKWLRDQLMAHRKKRKGSKRSKENCQTERKKESFRE